MRRLPPTSPRVSCRLLLAAAVVITIAGAVGTPMTSAAEHAPGAPPSASKHPAQSPIAGHWEVDMQGDGRKFTWLFDLTVKGDSLGGILSISGRDDEILIAGTTKGNKLHFEQFGLWNGTLEGSGLKLTRGLDGGKVQHMTAHRAPKK